MQDSFEQKGKKYVSSRRLAEKYGYTNDHISRLCRRGKVEGRLISRTWFVDESALAKYQNISKDGRGKKTRTSKNEIPKSSPVTTATPYSNSLKIIKDDEPFEVLPKLSKQEEKEEGEKIRQDSQEDIFKADSLVADETHNTVSTETSQTERTFVYPKVLRLSKQSPYFFDSDHILHQVVMFAAILTSVFSVYAFQVPFYKDALYENVATTIKDGENVIDNNLNKLSDIATTANTSALSAASFGIRGVIDDAAMTVYEAVSGTKEKARNKILSWLNISPDTRQLTTGNSESATPNQISVPSGSDLSRSTELLEVRPGSGRTGMSQQPRVIERIIERAVPKVSASPIVINTTGITQEEFERRLEQLNNSLQSQITRIQGGTPTSNTIRTIYQTIAATNNIDQLDGVSITGSTITGSTFSGTNGSFDSLSSGTFTASGALTGTSATFSGDVSVSGSLSVSGGQTISGALTTPSFDATSTTATSTVAGNFTVGKRAEIYGPLSLSYFTATSTDTASTIDYRLGIATSSPYARLSVAGDAVVTGNVTSSYFIATSSTASTFPYASTTAITVADLFPTNIYSFTLSGELLANGKNITNIGTATGTDSIFTNATTTNATSTNFFSTLGRFTTGIFTTLTSDTIVAVNGTTTNATSTNLYAASLRSAASTLGNATSTNIYISGQTRLGSLTGPLQAKSGVVSATSSISSAFIEDAYLKNDGDTATGDYNFDSNTLVIDATNNRVGIGTASPSSPLQIEGTPTLDGDNRIFADYTDTSSLAAGIGGGFNFGGTYTSAGDTAAWSGVSGIKENSTSGDYAGALIFTTRPAGGSQTERLRVTSAGLVGIGTTSPYAKLSVSGSAVFSGGDVRASTLTATSTATAKNFVASSASATTTLAGGLAVETSGLVYDYSTNRVGIGTASPGNKLNIVSEGLSTTPIAVERSTGASIFSVLENGAGNGVLYVQNSGGGIGVLLGSNQDSYFNGGNLGIGTTSPYAKLSVVGETVAEYFTATSTTATSTFAAGLQAAALNITSTTATSTFANGITLSGGCFLLSDGTCAGAGGGSGAFASSGGYTTLSTATDNVGIGTSSPYAKLSVVGEVVGEYFSATSTTATSTFAGNIDVKDLNFTGRLTEDGNEIFSGVIAPFASACPSGWTEYTAARGRTIVGTPSSGTNAGTVGTALTDLGTRTITDVPAHTHTVDPPSTTSSTAGSHSHSISTYSYSDFNTDGVVGNGWSGSGLPSRNTSSAGSHSHTVDIAAFTSGSTGVSSVDVTMPYIQLTYCQKNAGADLAEWIPADENISAATIVSVDPEDREKVVVSKKAYDNTVVGVVSTAPGWIMGTEARDNVQLALAGRVPVVVSLKNGEINPGDPITTSSIPGVGMKASQQGAIIGKAMEHLNETSSVTSCLDPTTGREEKCGTVLVFVNNSWYDPSYLEYQSDTVIAKASELYYEELSFASDFTDGDLVSITYKQAPTQENPDETVRMGTLAKATPSLLAGVISTKIGGDGELLRRERKNNEIVSETRLVTTGTAEVRIDPNSSSIQPGDPIAASKISGLGTKATGAGFTIGVALESWAPGSSDTILISVGISWQNPYIAITNLGDLAIVNEDGTYTLQKEDGDIIDSKGVFSELLSANVTAGKIVAQEIAIIDPETGEERKLSEYIRGGEVTLDGQGESAYWQMEGGYIKYIANVDLNDFSIRDVSSISGSFGKWSIDSGGNIKANTLCLGDTCVNENQLKALLLDAGLSSGDGPSESKFTENSTDEASGEDQTQTASSTPPTSEPEPEPTATSTPETITNTATSTTEAQSEVAPPTEEQETSEESPNPTGGTEEESAVTPEPVSETGSETEPESESTQSESQTEVE